MVKIYEINCGVSNISPACRDFLNFGREKSPEFVVVAKHGEMAQGPSDAGKAQV